MEAARDVCTDCMYFWGGYVFGAELLSERLLCGDGWGSSSMPRDKA